MDRLINDGEILLQCTCTSNHNAVYFKYLIILSIIRSIKPEKYKELATQNKWYSYAFETGESRSDTLKS